MNLREAINEDNLLESGAVAKALDDLVYKANQSISAAIERNMAKKPREQWEWMFNDYQWQYTSGGKYFKIVQGLEGKGKSVIAFVDKQTGDIYKAAGWAKPAKHARGNVLDDSGGADAFDGWGTTYISPRYLR